MLVTCFACKDYLRRPTTCSSCKQNYCERCTYTKKDDPLFRDCPNKECNKIPYPNRSLDPISRVVQTMLSKLIMKCPECKECVRYDIYEDHLIKHHFCSYCSMKLTNWNEIRSHYYETCPKYKINCSVCEFKFDREEYVKHDCLTYYDMRSYELLLFSASMLVQTIMIGFTKSFNPQECELIGGVKSYIKSMLPNILLLFWVASFWVNFRSLQTGHGKINTIEWTIHKVLDQGSMYLSLLCNCFCFFVINNITIKYNSTYICHDTE